MDTYFGLTPDVSSYSSSWLWRSAIRADGPSLTSTVGAFGLTVVMVRLKSVADLAVSISFPLWHACQEDCRELWLILSRH